MANFDNKDYSAEYIALKAANNRLREGGKQWLWNALDRLCSEINRQLTERLGKVPLQVGRQEWQFQVGNATMIGERFGARYQGRTLIVEVGWPRLPEHGYVPDGGLARGCISLSQNTMLEAQTISEIILTRKGKGEPAWYLIANKILGEQLTESRLRNHLNLILAE